MTAFEALVALDRGPRTISASRAIAAGVATARRAGVRASGEQLHGAPARRFLARLRDAQFIVVGARRRWLARSVSRALIRRADRPVRVARRTSPVVA